MNIKSLARLSAPFALGFLPLPSLAQGVALEEIIVTAQKRSENVQDVPISISAFGANELLKAGVTSYNDIGMVTPGLETTRQIGSATPFLRGIGAQSGTVGVESATTMFVDDVYVSSTVDASLNFNNIERIEVLKGPQGTLFGRNTTGGVVHIITKDPGFDPQLDVGVYVGSYKTTGGTLYASNGLSKTIAADLSVSVQNMSDYYGTNIANGDGVGYEEHVSVRSKLIWLPSDRTRARFIVGWSERDEDVGITRQCSRDVPEYGCMTGQRPTPDFHDTNSDATPEIHNKTWSLSAKINHEFDLFDFVSITSYNHNENFQLLDQDSMAAPVVTAPISQTNKTFSQEFQILSNHDDKPYNWILGLYYWNDDSRYDPLELYGLALAPATNVRIYSGVDTQSIAVFAQTTIELGEKTGLTLGLRWTRDERENSGHTEMRFGDMLLDPSFKGDESWSEPTWRIALNRHFSDALMGYATYNRGFKSGTYNTVNTGGVIFDPVDPEILDAYEVGIKGDFLDGRLRVNASAFYYEYENIQLQKIDGSIAYLLNAAEAEISGFEVEGQFAVTDHLSLRLGFAYLDSEYTDFEGCPLNIPDPAALGPLGPGNIRVIGDCTGNSLIRAPDYTYNLGFTYFVPTAVGTFGASATLAYNDGFYWEPDNRASEDAFYMLNGELSWSDASERFRIRLFGKNLLDEEYSIYTTAAEFGDTEAPAPPRTWGLGFDMSVF